MEVVGREQCAHGNGLVNSVEGLAVEIGIQLELFGVFGSQTNLGHFFHGFKRVLTGGGFSAEHDGVGAIQNRIGHIAHFSACGHWVGDHAFHHLRGRDDHLVVGTGQLDHALLQSGNHGIAHFHGQVAAGHHDAVAGQQNFFQARDGFCTLNFGNQGRLVVVFGSRHIGQLTGHFHVGGIFRKTHGQIVGLKAHRCFDVFHVLGRQGGCREAPALFVNAFVVGQLTAQLDRGVDHFAMNRINGEHNQAIVQQQHVASFDIAGQFFVVKPNTR